MTRQAQKILKTRGKTRQLYQTFENTFFLNITQKITYTPNL